MARKNDFGTDSLFQKKDSYSVVDQLYRSDINLVEKSIPIEEVHPFPNHPFKVQEDDAMIRLVSSIKTKGLLEPVIVRKIGSHDYEMLSGHRRMRACELAGITEMKALIVEVDDDQAIGIMVDSNMHRPDILPSEKSICL